MNQQATTVILRVRPLVNQENDFAWDIEDNQIQLLPTKQTQNLQQSCFQFQTIYDTNISTAHMYQEQLSLIATQVYDGLNCTLLAYGQSSAGKTHTMFGNQKDPGIIKLVLKDIFSKVNNTSFNVKMQFVELYNENLVDLLTSVKKQPVIREDQGNIILQNIEEPKVTSVEQCMSLINQGQSRRTTSETNLNETSSRSHAIIRIVLEQSDLPAIPNAKRKQFKINKSSVLTLVDLAGSEKQIKTSAQGQRLKESNAINQSLLTLGIVINALANNQQFVPYRDSKLTRLLQNSLGGNALSYIIGCISPDYQHTDESINTMRFCSRATKVLNKAKVNEFYTDSEKLEKALVQNKQLKVKIKELQSQIGCFSESIANMSNISLTNNDSVLETSQKNISICDGSYLSLDILNEPPMKLSFCQQAEISNSELNKLNTIIKSLQQEKELLSEQQDQKNLDEILLVSEELQKDFDDKYKKQQERFEDLILQMDVIQQQLNVYLEIQKEDFQQEVSFEQISQFIQTSFMVIEEIKDTLDQQIITSVISTYDINTSYKSLSMISNAAQTSFSANKNSQISLSIAESIQHIDEEIQCQQIDKSQMLNEHKSLSMISNAAQASFTSAKISIAESIQHIDEEIQCLQVDKSLVLIEQQTSISMEKSLLVLNKSTSIEIQPNKQEEQHIQSIQNIDCIDQSVQHIELPQLDIFKLNQTLSLQQNNTLDLTKDIIEKKLCSSPIKQTTILKNLMSPILSISMKPQNTNTILANTIDPDESSITVSYNDSDEHTQQFNFGAQQTFIPTQNLQDTCSFKNQIHDTVIQISEPPTIQMKEKSCQQEDNNVQQSCCIQTENCIQSFACQPELENVQQDISLGQQCDNNQQSIAVQLSSNCSYIQHSVQCSSPNQSFQCQKSINIIDQNDFSQQLDISINSMGVQLSTIQQEQISTQFSEINCSNNCQTSIIMTNDNNMCTEFVEKDSFSCQYETDYQLPSFQCQTECFDQDIYTQIEIISMDKETELIDLNFGMDQQVQTCQGLQNIYIQTIQSQCDRCKNLTTQIEEYTSILNIIQQKTKLELSQYSQLNIQLQINLEQLSTENKALIDDNNQLKQQLQDTRAEIESYELQIQSQDTQILDLKQVNEQIQSNMQVDYEQMNKSIQAFEQILQSAQLQKETNSGLQSSITTQDLVYGQQMGTQMSQIIEQENYKLKYDELNEKFERLLTQSRDKIQMVVQQAQSREEKLISTAKQQLSDLKKYKDVVLKMQEKQILVQKMKMQQQLISQQLPRADNE